jgi:hypothetical protein
VCDDQQPEFRSLSEFYIINFLHKLKIVENTLKLRKQSWSALQNFSWGPVYDILKTLTQPAVVK